MPSDELAPLLELFYGEVRPKKKSEFSIQGLISIRAGLNRYLQAPPYNRNINIISDSDFKQANMVHAGKINKQKEAGLHKTSHFPVIKHCDFRKLYDSGTFSNQNPKSLQYKVFFETMLHFSRKTELYELTTDSFEFQSDHDGRAYVIITSNSEKIMTENGSEPDRGVENEEKRMYETKDNPDSCPLVSLRLYLSKLNPTCPYFFQHLSRKCDTSVDQYWYSGKRIGINTLGGFMKEISKEAKLSQIYTNSSVRFTAIDPKAAGYFAIPPRQQETRNDSTTTGGLHKAYRTPVIEHCDYLKMYDSGTLSNKNPKALQYKVFVETLLHVSRKADPYELTTDSFEFHADSEGRDYVTIISNSEKTQTNHDLEPGRGMDKEETRIYETEENPDLCPVASLRLYLSKLNPKCPYFFQHITRKLSDPYWYNGKRVGINTVGGFMKEISKEAKLSQIYTNSSVRFLADSIAAGYVANPSRQHEPRTDNKRRKIGSVSLIQDSIKEESNASSSSAISILSQNIVSLENPTSLTDMDSINLSFEMS